MRKIVLLLVLLAIGTIAFSQEITVRFTGQLNGTSYCRLDRVAVINVTRNWTEIVEYPDTIIVLGGTVGTDLNIAATQGLGQNIPNPFDCETRVELSVSQSEDVRMQLLDVAGKLYAEYNGSLDAGVHTFDISAANPQTYLLNAMVGNRQYSIRMVNVGSGCGSSIKYAGISGGIEAKLTSANEFQIGDNMRYVGYVTVDGEVVASTAVEQTQTASEDITLNFAHCINTFGTDIQTACESYTWIDDITYTESTNEPTFTLTNAVGCDSVVTLHLTINHSNTGIDEQTACDSYEWIDGVTYTESTTEPTFTLTNAAGCDSVVTLHLTINHSNTGIDEQTACESYTWIDGVTYTESTNEPTFTLNNVAGCDSVVTLHLTINHNTGVDTQVACDSYTWIDGVTYTVSTDEPTYTLTNVAGCDSVVTLYLTIACLPTVQTIDATDITVEGATLSGNVTSDGGATVTARGFLYGTSENNLTQIIQSGSGIGSYTLALTDLTSSTTYYYKAYATNTAGTAYGDIMSFTTVATTGTLNGHEWIDLGLPSGLRWATCDIGANNPEEEGAYFAWGETSPKENYTWENYRFCNRFSEGNEPTNFRLTKYNSFSDYGYVDNRTTLESCDDAATVNWGSGWRMPTVDEFAELINNCSWTYIPNNGNSQIRIVGPNGNFIVLNSNGYRCYYWSSSLGTDVPYEANGIYSNYYVLGVGIFDRYEGIAVRAVRSMDNTGLSVTTSTASSISTTIATISGSVTTDNEANITDRGFIYGTNYSNLTQTVQRGNGVGDFTANISGLTSGTTYYYKAYATNALGTSYGALRSFTTVSLPIVTTGTASGITRTEATLSGSVSFDEIIISRGFVYGTSGSDLSNRIECGSGTGSFTGAITDLTLGTTYYYKAYATSSDGTFYGEVKRFSTLDSSYGVINGHYWVDLGLPSGTCWATCNLGTSSPTEYGNYYAWGETTTKTTYSWSTYLWCNESYNALTKYNTNIDYSIYHSVDNLTTLESSDDAATSNWGTGWRMPTREEMNELLNNCNCVWTTQNGVYGEKFIGPNGNIIFLPAAGYYDDSGLINAGTKGRYWSSSLGTGYPYYATNCYIYSDYYGEMSYNNRSDGLTIRPVCSSSSAGVAVPSVITGTVSNITGTNATLSGNVADDGGATITDRGFLYGTSSNYLTRTVQSGSVTGNFTANLTDLTSGTTYYYKAYASNTERTAYGEVRTFTTPTTPTVTTVTTGNVTATGARLYGEVTANGGATVTARGFIYGTNSSNLTQTIQSGSGTGDFTANITGLTANTTYYYKAYATNSAGTAYGGVKSFMTECEPTGYVNGYGYVDLGLPSGTLWATCNIGANNPEDYGDYFAWGETSPKSTYSWSTYSLCNNSFRKLTKYCNNSSYGNNGFTDALTTLEASDDAATANWGSVWRMPTYQEFDELLNNCTKSRESGGELFIGPNGNSIFLPAAGYYDGSEHHDAGSYGHYWSSSLLDTGNSPYKAWYLYFYTVNLSYHYRIYGRSVRPVCSSQN